MQFKKTEDLKAGMRLARPIYNRDGVLLYERDSKLTQQGITSIENFGLIGIFILEPAEPVPPMTKADIEFERFQVVNVFAIKEAMQMLLATGKKAKLDAVVASINKSFGSLDERLNFVQNLRSKEDYVYKHALNVAILCAMMGSQMNLKLDERRDVITAALICDMKEYSILEQVYEYYPGVRRYCQQALKIAEWVEEGRADTTARLKNGSRILAVAQAYDDMTAMSIDKEAPASSVIAVKYLMDKEEFYSEDIIAALVHSISILGPGVCVELSTGEKGLVLEENLRDFLRPVVLVFGDNTILDFSDQYVYEDVEITDIMKTMDRRHFMGEDVVKEYGFGELKRQMKQ